MPTRLRSAVSLLRNGHSLGLTAALVSGLLTTPLMAAATKVVLVASSPENLTERGLTALGVAHQRLSPREFRDFSTLDADILVWGFDEPRQSFVERRDELVAFLRAGGVFLGFRCPEDESWLPAAVSRDKAYEWGEILRPNATSLRMPQHEDQFWIADHTLAGCHVGHRWVEGMAKTGPNVRSMSWYGQSLSHLFPDP